MGLEGASRRRLFSELRQCLAGSGSYEGSQDELTRLRDDWPSLIPFCAVASLLMARPSAARWLVRKTVDNYSLPEDAARGIRDFAEQDLAKLFSKNA